MLKNKINEKEFLKRRREKIIEAKESVHQETYLYIVFTMVGLFIVLVANGKSDYDKVDTVQNQTRDNK